MKLLLIEFDVIMGSVFQFWEQSWVEGCGFGTIRQVAI
jgi:hypothetical protein